MQVSKALVADVAGGSYGLASAATGAGTTTTSSQTEGGGLRRPLEWATYRATC
jgi:hypothetical protein